MNQQTGQIQTCCKNPKPKPKSKRLPNPKPLRLIQGLPATQGLVGAHSSSSSAGATAGGGGTCPTITNIPPVDECSGRQSNCWSVGQTDVDCVNHALCCFDGCANVCQGNGKQHYSGNILP